MSDESPVGRPTDYLPEYNDQVFKLCLLGAIDKDLADFFEVSESTLNLWKQKHLEFSESIKSGKAKADMHLAHKLYNRAEGAEWIEDVAFKVKRTEYADGKKVLETEDIVTAPVRKAAPPDTTALIFWLKNRKSSNWRDKQDHEITGKDGKDLIPVVNLTIGTKP